MKVKEICTWEPRVCSQNGTLADVARTMWEGDCGTVPIVDASGKVVGMVSQRDVTMAAVMKDRAPRYVEVREVMTGPVFGCGPEDDVGDALKVMAEKRVRHLPVLDDEGRLKGILSISDCVRNSRLVFETGEPGIPSNELLAALKALAIPWRKFFRKDETVRRKAARPT